MVGLDAAEGDDCVGAILQRLGDQELKLPYLRTQPHMITNTFKC